MVDIAPGGSGSLKKSESHISITPLTEIEGSGKILSCLSCYSAYMSLTAASQIPRSTQFGHLYSYLDTRWEGAEVVGGGY